MTQPQIAEQMADGSYRDVIPVALVFGGASGSDLQLAIPDGGDTAEGATTDIAYTDATGAGVGTVVRVLKGLFVRAALGATAAKQPALGVAGTPSADVITVQGDTSGTPLPGAVADGDDVALGAKVDAVNSLAGTASLIALVKGLQRPLNQSYVFVDAATTAGPLGATGAVGDTLTGLIITPLTVVPGVVSITDGDGTAIVLFVGGASSVADLKPFFIAVGARCSAATTSGWYVTTGNNVSVVAVGNFT